MVDQQTLAQQFCRNEVLVRCRAQQEVKEHFMKNEWYMKQPIRPLPHPSPSVPIPLLPSVPPLHSTTCAISPPLPHPSLPSFPHVACGRYLLPQNRIGIHRKVASTAEAAIKIGPSHLGSSHAGPLTQPSHLGPSHQRLSHQWTTLKCCGHHPRALPSSRFSGATQSFDNCVYRRM